MAKIIRLKTKTDDVIEKLEEALQLAKEGKIKSFILAAEADSEITDPYILTAWANADLGTRQVLIGHLQADVMAGMIEELLEE